MSSTKKHPVKHKTKKLYDASFWGISKSRKRVEIVHNYLFPYGIAWTVSWYHPKNIEPEYIQKETGEVYE
ncbi:hypothetical protein [Paenibacillus dendritiformis]|uniref:hypothetical protein n=1 Tax=Paenibacillus dendritiformis TaxID=130049 RepID=UPI00387E1254